VIRDRDQKKFKQERQLLSWWVGTRRRHSRTDLAHFLHTLNGQLRAPARGNDPASSLLFGCWCSKL